MGQGGSASYETRRRERAAARRHWSMLATVGSTLPPTACIKSAWPMALPAVINSAAGMELDQGRSGHLAGVLQNPTLDLDFRNFSG